MENGERRLEAGGAVGRKEKKSHHPILVTVQPRASWGTCGDHSADYHGTTSPTYTTIDYLGRATASGAATYPNVN